MLLHSHVITRIQIVSKVLSRDHLNTKLKFLVPLSIPFRSLAAIVSEKSTLFTFCNRKAEVTKFELAVKKVKVTQGLSFEQTLMGWTLQYYIPTFVEIGPLVPEKKIFKGFYHIWA